jgi:hypothetical protein
MLALGPFLLLLLAALRGQMSSVLTLFPRFSDRHYFGVLH